MQRNHLERLAIACGLVAFAWVLLRTAWLCDDAFISFRVVENFVSGHGLRWNIADRVQVFTHPLWMLLHVPIHAITGEIYYSSLTLSAAISLGVAWQLMGRAASTVHAGILAAALILSSKAFVDYSTSGLENPLTHLLLVLFFVAGLGEGDDRRTLRIQALIAGLLIVNRLDTLLLVLPTLTIACRRLGIRRSWTPILWGFGSAIVWFSFATAYYGSPFPNTALAKLGGGTGLTEMMGLGFRYFVASAREDPVTLLVVAGALVAAVLARRHLAIASGAAAYLAYILWIGGDFMNGRFLTAPFVLAVCILVSMASRLTGRGILAVAAGVVVVGLLPAGAPLTSGPEYGRARDSLIDPYGIADERAYYFRHSGLWNGAATAQPRDDKWLEATTARECNFPLLIAGAVGFYGHEAGPTIHILDYNALADPVLSRLPAVREDRLYLDWYRNLEGRDPATPRRIGHFLRNIPPGYVSFLLGNGSKFESADMRRHVETVTRSVRAPLLSRERIDATLEIVGGGSASNFDGPEFREFRPVPINEILTSDADPVFSSTVRGCAMMNSNPTAALESLRLAVAGCDANGLALRCLGGAARLAGFLDEAVSAHELLAEHAPQSDWAHYELGHTLLVARRPTDAIAAFDRALQLNPWNITARRGLASAHAGVGNLGAAVEALENAVALRPTRASLWRELAQVRDLAGDSDGATAARAEASRLDR